ncbi:hypothetical protein BDQ12DRAFT_76676 [Crucibulum laeve]|uniref:Uncharacterized protein n=1 Tax=Crucibulum laeve TaxID=68775 RepID=A0A5C3M1L1_9AGAR|nr:hypothetical protein BDQ12DRAFT_76676 [Crucibulum laeve]
MWWYDYATILPLYMECVNCVVMWILCMSEGSFLFRPLIEEPLHKLSSLVGPSSTLRTKVVLFWLLSFAWFTLIWCVAINRQTRS